MIMNAKIGSRNKVTKTPRPSWIYDAHDAISMYNSINLLRPTRASNPKLSLHFWLYELAQGFALLQDLPGRGL